MIHNQDEIALTILKALGVTQKGITKAVITFEVGCAAMVEVTSHIDLNTSFELCLKKYNISVIEDEG